MTQSDFDTVDRAFADLYRRSTAVAAPPAEQIIGRGRRRRTTRIALTGCAVIVALLASYALASPSLRGDASPAHPTATATPEPRRPLGLRDDLSRTAPFGLLLHQTTRSTGDGLGQLPPCLGDPVTGTAVSFDVGGPPTTELPPGVLPDWVQILESLLVYGTEAEAEAVFDALDADLPGCLGFPDSEPTQHLNPAWGEEAVAVTIPIPADGAGDFTGMPLRMAVVRGGTALVVLTASPSLPGTGAEVDQEAKAMGPRLCAYDPDCRPRAGLPPQLTALTDGGTAWVAVIQLYEEGDPEALPGVGVGIAAELGYRASLVPVACDEGAAEPLRVDPQTARYVAVYFATNAEVVAFGDAYPSVRAHLEVRTRCVGP